MVADVSGLVNILATQPGQNVAQVGATLAAAQASAEKRKQQLFENQRQLAKDALEKDLAENKITESKLSQIAKRAEIATPIAQEVLMTKDPLARRQVFEQSVPTLKKLGMPDQTIQESRDNLDNPHYWLGKVAQGLSAKDVYMMTTGSGKEGTVAAKKKQELIDAGVPPIQAEGIAYGTYRTITDPSTGDQKIVDMRNGGQEVPPEVADVVKDKLPSPNEMYKPKIITKGNKEELRIQSDVQKLSDDMIKTGAPKVESSLGLVESIIDNTYNKGKDLPGVGVTSALPDWAVSQQAQDLRQASIKLFNIELAERSGAAVTKQELDRLKDEFKSGLWRTDRQFVQGVQQYRALLEDYKKAVVAGYDPNVTERYVSQGGIKIKGMEPKKEEPTITEEQIRADAKEYGWTEEQTQSAIDKYVRK